MPSAKIIQFKNWINEGEFRSQIIKGGGISLFIQVGFAGLAFINSSVLARFLGVSAYGAYVNGQSWTNVLIPVAILGFDSLLIRNVSIFISQKRWAEFRGITRFSNLLVLVFSVILILSVFVVSSIIYKKSDEWEIRTTLWLATFIIPLSALASLRQATIRGFEHFARALLPDMIFRPTLLLTGVIGLYFIAPQLLTSQSAMVVSVAAATVSLGISTFWLKKMTPGEVSNHQPEYHAREWIVTAVPLMVTGTLNLLLSQTSPILLGLQANAEAIGLYSAAFKIAYLALFFPYAVEIVIAPIVARLYANGEKERLQKILTTSAWFSFLASLAMTLFSIFCSNFLLSLFGKDFTTARETLLILAFGNLGYAALESSAILLNMTGQQKAVAVIFGVFSVFNVALNIIMIPRSSYEGAAVASAISLILCRIILMFYAREKMGLNSSIFRLRAKLKAKPG